MDILWIYYDNNMDILPPAGTIIILFFYCSSGGTHPPRAAGWAREAEASLGLIEFRSKLGLVLGRRISCHPA